MTEKIQLLHPAGKHAVRIDVEKYNIMRSALLKCLPKNKRITHGELLEKILIYLKTNHIKFAGSVEWYMEGVKLDLEAKKLILRSEEKGKQYFRLA